MRFAASYVAMTMRQAITMLGLGLLMVIAGCQSPIWTNKDTKPFPELADRTRSQVLPDPNLLAAQKQAGITDQGLYLNWYDMRNDYRPTVVDSYMGPTYDSSVTYSHERSTSWGNRVFDYSSSSTHRVRVQQTLR